MRILFDTCVAFDIFGKSADFFESYCSYDVALLRGFVPCLSVSSTTDVCYLLHARGAASKKEARRLVGQALDLFELVDNTEADCKRASADPMDDYEDALLAQSAQRAGVELILTWNKKDFARSPVAALTPKEFLRAYKPPDVEYALADI